MSNFKLSKDFLIQALFTICILVTYLNIYELTFFVWITTLLFTIKRYYSFTIINYIIPFIAILLIAFISWFYYDFTVYEVIRDITYLVKPIVGLILGYQLCRNAKLKVIQTIIYVGLIISIIHLGLVIYSSIIHKILNIHELRKYSGYFSDFEVYSLVLVIFNKKFNLEYSKQKIILLISIIGLSCFLYLSRANFIQVIVFYLTLKGYFTLNKKTLIILLSFFSIVIIGYSIIFNMNLSRNGKGLDALLYKIKNAPIEAFKAKVDKDDWKDFNDNYRAYENMITIRAINGEGSWGIIRGKGLGSYIPLGQKLFTNEGTVLTKVSILHNGYMTVLLKSGILGIILLLYFLIILIKQNKTNNLLVNQLNLLLIATALYLFFDNWVLLGLYLKTESKAIVIGFLLAYKELILKQETINF